MDILIIQEEELTDHPPLNLISKFLKVFKLIFGVVTIVSIAFIIISCPKPIDDNLLIQVQDEFDPSIIITSPIDDSYYYSSITIEGTITDSALAANDGVGELASISYTVANDVLRQGKISFASDRSYTKDTGFGSGDILYDEDTGAFNITFSTIEVDGVTSFLQQRVTITIEVIDRNNNSATKIVRLLENDGPYINLEEPGTTLFYFSAGSLIEISGSIGNSYFDQDHADQIESIMWRVSNQAWSGTLDLTDDSSDFNGTIYSVENVALQYSDPFTYNPVNQGFTTSFDLPFGDFSVIPIEVRATDQNNHTSYATFNMYTNEAGPVMNFTFPDSTTTGIYKNGSDFYVNPSSVILANFNIAWTLDSDGPLDVLGYAFESDSFTDDQDPDPGVTNAGNIFIDGNKINVGELLLTIRAVNNDSKESRYYFDVKADGTAPVVTINTFNAGSAGDYYAKPGDTINLSFDVDDVGPADAVSGLPAGLNPSVSIDDIVVGSGYTYSYFLPDDPDTNTEDLALDITGVQDNVGNVTSFTEGNLLPNVRIKYYSGSETISITSVLSDNVNSTSDWAKVGDEITLLFSSPRDLIDTPVVTIAGQAATETDLGGNNYSAVYPMVGGEPAGNILYSIDYTDAAGNPGDPITSTPTGITFDNKAPNFVYNLTDDLIGMESDNFTLLNADSTVVYFYFSEEVVDFEQGDVLFMNEGGGIGALSGATDSFTATFSADSNESLGNRISVAAGSYTDLAGNPGSYGESGSYDVDTIAPTINIGTPLVLNASGGTTTAAPTDNGSGINTSTYSWTQISEPSGGTIDFGTVTAENTTISANVDGDYVIRLTVDDLAGNPNYADLDVKWDATLPAINIGSALVLNASGGTTTAAPTDNGSGINTSTYSWTQISEPSGGTIDFGTVTAENTTISANVDGDYVIRLTVDDLAGNPNYADLDVKWDATLPTIQITSPTGTISNSTTVTLAVYVTDGGSGVSRADGTVQYKIDSGFWTTLPWNSGDEYIIVNLSFTDETLYLISFRATDIAGNITGDDVNEAYLTIDAGPVGVVSITNNTTSIVILFNLDLDTTEVETTTSYDFLNPANTANTASWDNGSFYVTLGMDSNVVSGDVVIINAVLITEDGSSDALGGGDITYIIP